MNFDMDWEITEFAETLYNLGGAMTIESIEANLESFLLANHYRKADASKMRVLSDSELWDIWQSAKGSLRKAIAQAQLAADIKAMEEQE